MALTKFGRARRLRLPSVRVALLRQRNRVGFGDGGNIDLRNAIRAHAHFAEYVPIIALMVAFLEMSGSAPAQIHALMGMLLIARAIHPIGMHAKPGTLQFSIGRVGGMVITIVVMMGAALRLLSRFLSGV